MDTNNNKKKSQSTQWEVLDHESNVICYVPVQLLGRGAYGKVYSCQIVGINNRHVAVKRVPVNLVQDANPNEQGFLNPHDFVSLSKWKTLRSLQHANVVRFLDFHFDADELHGDDFLIVMEYCQGKKRSVKMLMISTVDTLCSWLPFESVGW